MFYGENEKQNNHRNIIRLTTCLQLIPCKGCYSIFYFSASKASTDTSLGGNWFDFGSDTKTSSTNDNWASVFDSQPKTTSESTNIWNSLSSQNTTAVTVNGKTLAVIIC